MQAEDVTPKSTVEQPVPDSNISPERDKGAGNTTSQATTTNFPQKRIGIASLYLIIGFILAYGLTVFAPLNPTPFDSEFTLFKGSNWIQPIEKNGFYRVTMINNTEDIREYAATDDQLLLRLADDSRIAITSQGLISRLRENTDQGVTTEANITFNFDRDDINAEAAQVIENVFSSIDLAAIQQVQLFGYTGLYNRRIQNPEQPQRQLKITQSNSAADANTEIISPAYAMELGEQLANSAATFISSNYGVSRTNIVSTSYGLDRHFEQSWRQGPGNVSGVFIQVTYTVNSLNWQPFPAAQSVVSASAEETRLNWNIIDGSIFNVVSPNEDERTVAALATAFLSRDPDIVTQDASSQLVNLDKLPVPQLYPSVLSFLVMMIFGYASVRALRVDESTSDTEVITEQNIIDNFVSDAPASDKSQDKLGFVEISQALSSFLRNIGTKAPLTLAITGVWGSGKSSLMYFLKENLSAHRLRPIWINAWHHQNEEQFLAGLLNQVQASAIPNLWEPAGLLYRWNLFRMRWQEAPLKHTLATLVFFGSISYWVTMKLTDPEAISLQEPSLILQNTLALLTTIAGTITLVFSSMDKISGLVKSSNPIRWLIGTPGKGLDLRSQVGIREEFAREFNLLCQALGDSTLTIFIDDLDRCKESRIMDVMETLNYLVSSGDCFIVLGLEREPVERAIMNYYRNTFQDLSKEELHKKARRYLEKIINIEIPVPPANSKQARSLIGGAVQPEKSKTSWLSQLLPLAFLVAVVGSVFLGAGLSGVVSIESALPERQQVQKTDFVNESDATVRAIEQSPGPTLDDDSVALTVSKSPPESHFIVYSIPLLIIGLLAIIVRVERYQQRKHIVVQDSAPFLKAVSVWAQVLGEVNHTPRRIKRYVNRARYLAMRNEKSNTNIKEENLVTLTALMEFKEDSYSDVDIERLKSQVPDYSHKDFSGELKTLLSQSNTITEENLGKFLLWIRGFRLSGPD